MGTKVVAIDQKKKQASLVFRRFKKMYPDAKCELAFSSVFELAVAVILSAQCTDKRVNMVTPAMFKKYKTVGDWAAASLETIEEDIHSTGFYRNKAKSICGLAKVIHEQYDDQLPQDLETLIKLPGIGRKSANVLLITGFNKPGITVDTHCKRLSKRLGLTESTDPDRIEMELKEILPRKHWALWSHCIVWHGRYCCFARKPNCSACNMTDICPSVVE